MTAQWYRPPGPARRSLAWPNLSSFRFPLGDVEFRRQLILALAGARVAQMIAGHDFFWFEHGDHAHPRSADAHHDKPGPSVCVQIRDLGVHDVAAGLPERLTGNDFPGFFALQLKEDPALQYVSETGPEWRCGASPSSADLDVAFRRHGCVLSGRRAVARPRGAERPPRRSGY